MTRISNSPSPLPQTTVAASSRTPDNSTARATAKPAPAKLQPGFDASYWSQLESLAGRPPANATDITFLREADAAWNERIELIRASRTAIWGSFYIVDADERGFQLFEELIAARRRGVEVCVAIDSLAHLATAFGDKLADRKKLAGLLEELKAAGGVVSWAGTLDDQLKNPGAGIHFKSLVSDNRVAIVGGRNIAEEYFGEWDDFDTRLEGPIVQQIGRATLELLRSCDPTPAPRRDAAGDRLAAQVQGRIAELLAKPPPAGGAAPTRPPVEFRLLTFDPLVDGRGDKTNTITEALIRTVERAQSEIVLTSNVVVPDEQLRGALVAAARRGVRVKLVTSGPEALNPALHLANSLLYGDLLAAGCEIYETSQHEHGKMYLVDGQVGAYGSYNASKQSDARNAEGLLFTNDRRVVEELRRCVSQTISKAERYTEPPNRFVGWLQKMAARLFGS